MARLKPCPFKTTGSSLGLGSAVSLFPALKRWAKLVRPYGTGYSFDTEYSSGAGYADDSFRPGSNNWGRFRSAHGFGQAAAVERYAPRHQMPNLWFEAHLKTDSGNFDVAGVTLPGVPFVIVGHNQRIGWGFTTLARRSKTITSRSSMRRGNTRLRRDGCDAQHRQETIHVKGKPDVTLDVVTTRHGPIITELIRARRARLPCAGLCRTAWD
jgi:acyl-homoserine lactone acylase PvdQ